jgi:hypothetical protein
MLFFRISLRNLQKNNKWWKNTANYYVVKAFAMLPCADSRAAMAAGIVSQCERYYIRIQTTSPAPRRCLRLLEPPCDCLMR